MMIIQRKSDPQVKLLVLKIHKTLVFRHRSLHPLPNYALDTI